MLRDRRANDRLSFCNEAPKFSTKRVTILNLAWMYHHLKFTHRFTKDGPINKIATQATIIASPPTST